MFSGLRRGFSSCWKPVQDYVRMKKDDSSDDEDSSEAFSGGHEPLLWCRDLEKHYLGDYSYAVFQGNDIIEDYSQVETGRESVYVGIYDGHGGTQTAQYLSDHLFENLIERATEFRLISDNIISRSIGITENAFISHVSSKLVEDPKIVVAGSCCLVGVLTGRTLYVANVGDSRAVLGTLNRSNKITAEQLSDEHNASREEVREQVQSEHQDDPTILVMKHGAWRVKGIIQVTRSIGDAYLKIPNLPMDEPSLARFRLPEPLRRPALASEPSIYTRILQPSDQFVILASDGLWEYLTNQEAVEIVRKNHRMGIAKTLIRKALKRAATRMNTTYEALKNVERGDRRRYHDDITVAVLFIDQDLLRRATMLLAVPELSVKGFVDASVPSRFSVFEEAVRARK